jgi:hypothetical protein
MNYLPVLVLNHNPPHLSLPISEFGIAEGATGARLLSTYDIPAKPDL